MFVSLYMITILIVIIGMAIGILASRYDIKKNNTTNIIIAESHQDPKINNTAYKTLKNKKTIFYDKLSIVLIIIGVVSFIGVIFWSSFIQQ